MVWKHSLVWMTPLLKPSTENSITGLKRKQQQVSLLCCDLNGCRAAIMDSAPPSTILKVNAGSQKSLMTEIGGALLWALRVECWVAWEKDALYDTQTHVGKQVLWIQTPPQMKFILLFNDMKPAELDALFLQTYSEFYTFPFHCCEQYSLQFSAIYQMLSSRP